MTAQSPNIRETLNNGVFQQIADISRELKLGDLLGWLIQLAANTETSIAVASNAITLAQAPSNIFDLVAATGTFTGRLTLLIGDGTVLPAPGQAVWGGPGSRSVRFNAGDAVLTVHAKYARADGVACVTASTNRQLGQRP